MTITAFPLAWPPGWKRTAAEDRTFGRFDTSKQSSVGNWRSTQGITVAVATQRLRAELDRMAVRGDDPVLSTNLKLRLDGLPRSDQAQPADPAPRSSGTTRGPARRAAWQAALDLLKLRSCDLHATNVARTRDARN
jgi:hypothetical protein